MLTESKVLTVKMASRVFKVCKVQMESKVQTAMTVSKVFKVCKVLTVFKVYKV